MRQDVFNAICDVAGELRRQTIGKPLAIRISSYPFIGHYALVIRIIDTKGVGSVNEISVGAVEQFGADRVAKAILEQREEVI